PQYQEDQRRLQSLRTRVVLWLIALALGVLLIPLMLITGWVRSDMTRLETELVFLRNAIDAATNPSAEVLQLGAEIAEIEQLITSMQRDTEHTGANWQQVIDAEAKCDQVDHHHVKLTHSDSRIQLTVRDMSNDDVERNRQRLQDTIAFR